jgi:hypothetical protein
VTRFEHSPPYSARPFLTSTSGAPPNCSPKDYVIGRWEGGGTHTGPAFSDLPAGSLPANSGAKMHFTGITILKVENGLIVHEKGLDDGVTMLKQAGLIPES